jgi:hypothetical protein
MTRWLCNVLLRHRQGHDPTGRRGSGHRVEVLDGVLASGMEDGMRETSGQLGEMVALLRG